MAFPLADGATFGIGAEVDGQREVTVGLTLGASPVGAGVVVPAYLSDATTGFGLSELGEIRDGGTIPVYPSHFQTDSSGEFTILVSYAAPGGPFYLVVVLPAGDLAVSGPLEFTA